MSMPAFYNDVILDQLFLFIYFLTEKSSFRMLSHLKWFVQELPHSMEKPINLPCKHLFAFTLENTLILITDPVNYPNMPMTIGNFSLSFEFIMFL